MAVTKERVTIQELRRKGLPVVPGSEYIPKSWIPKKVPTLQEIHKRLSKIKGDLAEEIGRMREEE